MNRNRNQSASQTGNALQPYQGDGSPTSLGASNMSTATARTAWSNKGDPYGTPTPLSKQTAGSFYKFDDGPTRSQE